MQRNSDWRQRWLELIGQIKRVQSVAEEQDLLQRLCAPDRPLVLAFANAHAMNSLATSFSFFEALRSADVVLRDGSGMATLFKLLKLSPGINLNGTDLIPRLLRHFNNRCIAVFGTQSPYLDKGLQTIAAKLAPGSRCLSAHGFLDVDAYIALVAAGRPGVIVLGMGMPRQEKVALALRASVDFPCLIICGGAIIDFLGGKTPRAPSWVRRAGMEWIFRLVREPKRLFRRYVIGNPVFLARALLLAALSWRGKKPTPDTR